MLLLLFAFQSHHPASCLLGVCGRQEDDILPDVVSFAATVQAVAVEEAVAAMDGHMFIHFPLPSPQEKEKTIIYITSWYIMCVSYGGRESANGELS